MTKEKNKKRAADKDPIKANDESTLSESREEQERRLGVTWAEAAGCSGARSPQVASLLISQAIRGDGSVRDGKALEAVRLLGEMAPQNAIEGMLAVQMIAVHNASVDFVRRSFQPGQTVGGVDTNIARAGRLMRLFIEQLEARAKLKGTSGRQKMTVEHVHVHAGGQAIVGPVARGIDTAKDKGEAK